MKAYKGGKASQPKNSVDKNVPNPGKEYDQPGKKITPKDSEKKFSGMLLQLIAPFHDSLPDLDELEWLLDIAAVAWNIANMNKLLPPAAKLLTEEAKLNFAQDKEALVLLEKLVKAKAKKYPLEDFFIKDIYVEPVDDDGGYITVVAVPLEDFLLDENDEEKNGGIAGTFDEEDNFSPGYINRNGFSVVPRQPFFNWLQKIEGNPLFPLNISESAIYLLEEKGSNEEIIEWLKENFDKVFRKELEGWNTDEKNGLKKGHINSLTNGLK